MHEAQRRELAMRERWMRMLDAPDFRVRYLLRLGGGLLGLLLLALSMWFVPPGKAAAAARMPHAATR